MDNPPVNRYLEDEAMDKIDHALGRPIWPDRESYRNRYCVTVGSSTARELQKSPHWSKPVRDGNMLYFSVTDRGREALTEYLALHDRNRAFVVTWHECAKTIPAETAAKAKYDYYLDLSDVFPDLSFKAFAATATVQVAA